MLPTCETLKLELDRGVLHLTLSRPAKRNAMNTQMVDELISVLDALVDDVQVRAILLRGEGGNFCAGGDISGMQKESHHPDDGKDASWRFNRSFGTLISKLNRAPQLTICVLNGAVLGGGFGLACASDWAIAYENAMFAMPETGLGIIPAQIAPFVVARIGLTQARQLALFGLRINGQRAQQLGLAHQMVNDDAEAEQAVTKVLELARKVGPAATRVTKQLIHDVNETLVIDSILDRAADDFSAAISSAEGQEGTKAFIEKRKPSWVLSEEA